MKTTQCAVFIKKKKKYASSPSKNKASFLACIVSGMTIEQRSFLLCTLGLSLLTSNKASNKQSVLGTWMFCKCWVPDLNQLPHLLLLI